MRRRGRLEAILSGLSIIGFNHVVASTRASRLNDAGFWVSEHYL